MLGLFSNIHPIYLAFIGGFFSFIITSLGAAIVFFFQKINKNVMDTMLSISAGIMLASLFFSLLNPAIEMVYQAKQNIFLFIMVGFLSGGLFIYFCNHFFLSFSFDEGSTFNFKRCLLLFTSITLHNIPEGLAIGVAFGMIPFGGNLLSAITLTLGISIQNFPEGSAVSLPLRREGISCFKSFLFGVFSGLVEPIAALLGAFLVLKIHVILPFILSFAAGAMLFVTVLELIPESQTNKNKDFMAFILMLGFAGMMSLELLLG